MSRTVNLRLLDRVDVASPCSVSWDGMAGNDRVRHCGQCRLHVYNLSEMTAEEAVAFVQGVEGRACVRFYRRADGTMITRDCPVGLRAVRMRAARAMARIAAGAAFLISGGLALAGARGPGARLRVVEPFATLCRWLSPTAAAPPVAAIGKPIMGALAGLGCK
jgi:hypothetical protein